MHDIDFVCAMDEIGIIEKGGKSSSDDMRMYGWASTPALDADNERVIQEGLLLNEYVEKGWINWNHQSDEIIGIPKTGEIKDRGEGLGKGFYTEFELIKGMPMAQKVWTLTQALKGTGRALGMSVEGKKLAVDNKGAILKARVVNVAVCPNPRNSETSVGALTKALIEGDADLSKFAYDPFRSHQLADRVESVMQATILKAMGSSGKLGSTDQAGGDAMRKESLEGENLIKVTPQVKDKIHKLNDDLKPLGARLLNVSEERGWRLTKAEAALFTFIVGDTDGTLLDHFRVFGL